MNTLYVWLSNNKDLPDGWIIYKYKDLDEIHCIKLKRQQLHTPTIVLHLLLIHSNLTWEVHTIHHLVSSNCTILNQHPSVLTDNAALSLIHTIDQSKVCRGNCDKHFVDLAKSKKGKFTTASGSCIATLEDGIAFMIDDEELYSTVRHVDCEIISSTAMCPACTNYRNTLRALVCKQTKTKTLKPHPKMNTRFLRTPQRNAHIKSLRAAIQNKNRQLKRIRHKLEEIVESDGVTVDDELSKDLESVIDDHCMDVRDEFKLIFLQQQVSKFN